MGLTAVSLFLCISKPMMTTKVAAATPQAVTI